MNTVTKLIICIFSLSAFIGVFAPINASALGPGGIRMRRLVNPERSSNIFGPARGKAYGDNLNSRSHNMGNEAYGERRYSGQGLFTGSGLKHSFQNRMFGADFTNRNYGPRLFGDDGQGIRRNVFRSLASEF